MVSPKEAKQMVKDGKAVLVDVREVNEHEQESIPGAWHYPLSEFHPSSLPPQKEKAFIFFCAAGVRSERARQAWQQVHEESKALNLEGGIHEWMEEGLEVSRDDSVARENLKRIFLLFGLIMVVTSLLAIFFSTWWLVLNLMGGAFFLLSAWKGDAGIILLVRSLDKILK